MCGHVIQDGARFMGRSTTRSGGALAARCDHDQVGDPGCTPARAAAAPARLRDRRDSQHHYQVGAKVPRSHGAETTSACASARVSVFLGSFRLRSAPPPLPSLGVSPGSLGASPDAVPGSPGCRLRPTSPAVSADEFSNFDTLPALLLVS